MHNRLGASLLALVVGLILGVVGTFGHRGVIGVGGTDLPWGIVVSVAGAACFLIGTRLYSGSRLVTLAGTVGLLVPIFVFSFQGPGGSVVIVGDTIGRIWDFAPALIAVGVLAWPRLNFAAPQTP
jgi:N-acetyl-1-D-myo-inositol-2-amino-2-deoxy-alpha-D-glucopyranoside deacetylase